MEALLPEEQDKFHYIPRCFGFENKDRCGSQKSEIENIWIRRKRRRIDRVIALGLIAASEAYEQAGLKNAEIDNYRFGTFVTSGIGGINTIFRQSRIALESGTDRISPFFIPGAIINLIGGNIAIKHRAKGPNLPVVTACSSGNDSIGQAFRNIRDVASTSLLPAGQAPMRN